MLRADIDVLPLALWNRAFADNVVHFVQTEAGDEGGDLFGIGLDSRALQRRPRMDKDGEIGQEVAECLLIQHSFVEVRVHFECHFEQCTHLEPRQLGRRRDPKVIAKHQQFQQTDGLIRFVDLLERQLVVIDLSHWLHRLGERVEDQSQRAVGVPDTASSLTANLQIWNGVVVTK